MSSRFRKLLLSNGLRLQANFVNPTSVKSTYRNFNRTLISVSRPLLEKQTMKVPTMGDSITEGTIVEWVVKVGQAVSDGDVVAMIETDKVTVEIKAEKNGVVTQQFGNVDDTVEVGSNLYEIDVDGVATEFSAAVSSNAAPEPVVAVESIMPSVLATGSLERVVDVPAQHRLPSIKFYGKDGWAKLKVHEKDFNRMESTTSKMEPVAPISKKPAPSKSGPSLVLYDNEIHPMYGRPKFTDEEMEALILGGASVAPEVIRPSRGAKFRVI